MLGKNRLYTIVMSESMHLIWKLRCEWRIARGEDAERALTELEIKGKWLYAINTRLKLDCLMTNKNRYGKKGLHPNTVLRTWGNTLKNESSLPENWLWKTGVLVGIG